MAGLGGGNKLLCNQPLFYKLHKLLTKNKAIPQKAARGSLKMSKGFHLWKAHGEESSSFTAYPVSPVQLCHPEGKVPPLENLAEELLGQGVCCCWRCWVERRCSNSWSTTSLPLLTGVWEQRGWCARTGRKWEVYACGKLVLQMCFYMVKRGSSKFCWLLWKLFCLKCGKKKRKVI